jgi:hypothetical protein
MRLAFTPYYKVTTNAEILCLQAKVPARKNASHPLKINTEPSSDDCDFVHPPSKRNRGPEHKPGNFPGNLLDPW